MTWIDRIEAANTAEELELVRKDFLDKDGQKPSYEYVYSVLNKKFISIYTNSSKSMEPVDVFIVNTCVIKVHKHSWDVNDNGLKYIVDVNQNFKPNITLDQNHHETLHNLIISEVAIKLRAILLNHTPASHTIYIPPNNSIY